MVVYSGGMLQLAGSAVSRRTFHRRTALYVLVDIVVLSGEIQLAGSVVSRWTFPGWIALCMRVDGVCVVDVILSGSWQ